MIATLSQIGLFPVPNICAPLHNMFQTMFNANFTSGQAHVGAQFNLASVPRESRKFKFNFTVAVKHATTSKILNQTPYILPFLLDQGDGPLSGII